MITAEIENGDEKKILELSAETFAERQNAQLSLRLSRI